MTGRLLSLLMLALGLLKTLLLRLTPSGNAVQKFNEVYGGENILSVTEEEAKLLAVSGRCTACGRCDARQAELILASSVGYQGMMAFALSAPRSLPEMGAVAYSVSELDETVFSRAESLCPERVPLVGLARLVRSHGVRLEAGHSDPNSRGREGR